MPFQETIELGVIVEQRKIDNPWTEYAWLPVAVLTSPPKVDDWRELSSSNGITRFHAATLPLELFRSDTEAYAENLNSGTPSIYVVLSEDDGDGNYPYYVSQITASPHEAQDILDSDETIVERVMMPDEVLAWINEFLDQHHAEKPFLKRKRDKMDIDEQKFGKDPIFSDHARQVRERRDG